MSKTSIFCSTKVLSQENLKLVDVDLLGAKNSHIFNFKCYNLAIYMVKNRNKNSIYAICTRNGSFGVFFLKAQILRVKGFND
jgi:hypothetical protein